jgi:acyl carrier protein
LKTLQKVIEIVGRETGAPNILVSTRLDALGLDSLEFVALMVALQDIATIPDEEWVALNTVKDIAEACERHL